MTTRLIAGAAAVLYALSGAACGGGAAAGDAGGEVSGDIQADAADSGGGEVGVVADASPDGAQPDAEVDTGPPLAGEFGAACNGNADCLSGWCVEGRKGYICTKQCELACPGGFDCKSVSTSGTDVAFLCMPRLQKLCDPCSDPLHCPGGACLRLDGDQYCGYACTGDGDCPEGHGCLEDPEGLQAGTWCQPLTGSCTCSVDFDGGQRACVADNELGQCFGIETCAPGSGWGECTAPEPSAEICDGLDNDCNGLVDEGLIGGGDCTNAVDGVGSCAGIEVCFGPQKWVCQGPVPELESCDFKDNDCDGEVDEDFKVDGVYSSDGHCGTCGNECAGKLPHATATCGGDGPVPTCVVESCDEGYIQQSPLSCILPPNVSCQPCVDDGGCVVGSCVEVDGQKSCLVACDGEEGSCPDGYACQDQGEAGSLCAPLTGSCGCNAANAGKVRSCVLDNAAGTCFGVESCDPALGWNGCTAPEPAEESCDGVDNDCNGVVDDGLSTGGDCVNEVADVGACAGTLVCLGMQGFVCQGPSPEVEACDFKDNDCDGQTDETFKAEGGGFTLSEHCGTCGNACADKFDHATGTCGGNASSPVCVVESCDEDYFKVNDFQCILPPEAGCQPCADDAACFGGSCVTLDGQQVCAAPCGAEGECADGFGCEAVADGVERCVPTTGSCTCGPSSAGKTRPCQVSGELGTCTGQEICDGASGWGGCTAPEAAAEVCDGKDNDCNGLVDDGLSVGEACDNTIDGVGSCVGVTVCLGQQGVVCQGPQPKLEACDFQDNDCDGGTDEDFKDGGGLWTLDAHCGTCGNACGAKIANGTGACGGSGAPVCVVAECNEGYVQLNDFQCALPPDVGCQPCQGDEDCFGGSCVAVDGPPVCVMPCGEAGACSTGFVCGEVSAGVERCLPASGSCACTEATAGQVRSCKNTNALGTCLGVEFCDPAVGWGTCSALEPAAEMCDGLDNDCNGVIDDGLPQAEVCENTVAGVGTCDGVNVCQGQAGWDCQGADPSLEACNFIDDDCDGVTDEEFKTGGVYALDGHCGSCGNNCATKIDNGVGRCGGTASSPVCVVDTCDLGFVKANDFQCVVPPDVNCQPCASDAACFGGSCLSLGGPKACVAACDSEGGCDAGYECVEVAGGVERCVPVSGSCSCLAEDAGESRPCTQANAFGVCFGQQVCAPDEGWGDCSASTPAEEICDGLDNDCDGFPDDGILQGEPCANELPGVGTCMGVRLCLGAAGLVCQGPQPQLEACDFKDNDCDGSTDEAFKVDGAWTLDGHCGTCGNDCTNKIDNGVGKCGGTASAPTCVVASCDVGFVKVNDFQCVTPPDVSCQPCASDADCFNGACVSVDGQDVCISPCGVEGCKSGFECGSVGGADGCVPVSGSCTCNTATAGQKRTCTSESTFGACFGVETCAPSTGWGGCTAPTPVAEDCNGKDDDCDGFLDESLPIGEACENTVEGVGSCPGTNICFGSQGWKCQGQVPTIESCDFLDNDCDAEVDEDFQIDEAYATFAHCGTCNVSCATGFPNALSTECATDGAAPQCKVTECQPGFAKINAFQCIPDVANLCQPCSDDQNCLGEASACVALNDGNFCGKGCGSGVDCPQGFVCSDVGKPQLQCVPATGSCSCDGSNTDLARACSLTYTPPDPSKPAYTCSGIEQCTLAGWGGCDVASEQCDGLDNNCDGNIDEPFRNATGQYATLAHCGGCGVSCLGIALSHAFPVCDTDGAVPTCSFGCDDGWFDVNEIQNDGCECAPIAGPDLAGDGVDGDCDGIDGTISLGIFVAKNGKDTNPGTIDKPVLTISKALTLASPPSKRDVYVATGVYPENVILRQGVGIFGGYSGDFTLHDTVVFETAVLGQAPTAAKPGSVSAQDVGASGQEPTILDGFTIFGPNVANVASANSYAVYLRDVGPMVSVRNNRVFGGAGGNGTPGGAGTGGLPGVNGTMGAAAYDVGTFNAAGERTCNATTNPLSGGAGGARTCVGGSVLTGGAGGKAGCPAYGVSPAAAAKGGAGLGASPGVGGFGAWAHTFFTGEATDPNRCNACYNPPGENPQSAGAGGTGAAGTSGTGGVGCSVASGSVADGHWTGLGGTAGILGSHGSGGGGGGSAGGTEVEGDNCPDSNNCCSSHASTGCTDSSVQACVCAGDPFCCSSSWDAQCVSEVTTFGCGGCNTSNLGGHDIGGSGGGGGSGGCLGTGGTGGKAGGGSFGMFVVFGSTPTSLPEIVGNTVQPGSGGSGGAGGPGGSGGAAGTGALGGTSGEASQLTWCARAGGVGGNGGQGGHGGGGGGGCGGASFGIYLWPPGDVAGLDDWFDFNTFLPGGTGGSASPGGASLGNPGTPGGAGSQAEVNWVPLP